MDKVRNSIKKSKKVAMHRMKSSEKQVAIDLKGMERKEKTQIS